MYVYKQIWALVWDPITLLGNSLIVLGLNFKLWSVGAEWHLALILYPFWGKFLPSVLRSFHLWLVRNRNSVSPEDYAFQFFGWFFPHPQIAYPQGLSPGGVTANTRRPLSLLSFLHFFPLPWKHQPLGLLVLPAPPELGRELQTACCPSLPAACRLTLGSHRGPVLPVSLAPRSCGLLASVMKMVTLHALSIF